MIVKCKHVSSTFTFQSRVLQKNRTSFFASTVALFMLRFMETLYVYSTQIAFPNNPVRNDTPKGVSKVIIL